MFALLLNIFLPGSTLLLHLAKTVTGLTALCLSCTCGFNADRYLILQEVVESQQSRIETGKQVSIGEPLKQHDGALPSSRCFRQSYVSA